MPQLFENVCWIQADCALENQVSIHVDKPMPRHKYIRIWTLEEGDPLDTEVEVYLTPRQAIQFAEAIIREASRVNY